MTCGTNNPQNEACKVGTVGPGGGWIFFVDYNEQYSGFNYLEAAPAEAEFEATWCDDTSPSIPTVASWSANAVGAGQRNTTAINVSCSSGAANTAASYSTETASDWFLGSEGEMKLMYNNLIIAGVGGFTYSDYWSSTLYNDTQARTQDFGFGNQGFYNIFDTKPFRPVRAF